MSSLDTSVDGNPAFRSLVILIVYLVIALSLTGYICRTIYSRWKIRRVASTASDGTGINTFALLAILSLAATWFYMFSFFVDSYHGWACKNGISGSPFSDIAKLELWLRETRLFREAWETVLETPRRFWWSQQIFLWTTAWSAFLGFMGRRYQIPNVWMYMLLGQIVAVSFAQNLFYLAILVSRASTTEPKGAPGLLWTPNALLEAEPLLISLVSTAAVPYATHTASFMLILLVPHLLLFVPCILHPRILPQGSGTLRNAYEVVKRRYIPLFSTVFAISLVLHAKATYEALADKNTSPTPIRYGCNVVGKREPSDKALLRLIGTMWEHPAVSSVSWDVLFCSVGFIAWAIVNNFSVLAMLGIDGTEQESMAKKAPQAAQPTRRSERIASSTKSSHNPNRETTVNDILGRPGNRR